jgi:hypothetical protein
MMCKYPRVVGDTIMMDYMLYLSGCAMFDGADISYPAHVHEKSNAEYLVLVKNGQMLTPMKWVSELGCYVKLCRIGDFVISF